MLWEFEENIIQILWEFMVNELRKKTPPAIPEANEFGAIVSMWSMMEGMVSTVLDYGYMTKGNGQNLTAFYFRTENE